ncbi:hypothetical protein ACFGVS_23825 [Mucilaginibacter sp. AW1-7]|uniref:hypothetical protein n=1 Tax=Mucilaginibacter sp. AW1-7 TaxID=3349874 RepID=UPI003F74186D
MLQLFTWQQFLIAAWVFSLIWLVVILLLFYRKEVFAFLSGSKPKVDPLKHAWQDDFEEGPDDLMGKVAEPDGVSVVNQNHFSFLPPETFDAAQVADDAGQAAEVLQTDLFDLMEDVKQLFDSKELDKTDLIEAVNAEVRRYPRLRKSNLLETFYLMVADQVNESATLDFEVTATELKGAL